MRPRPAGRNGSACYSVSTGGRRADSSASAAASPRPTRSHQPGALQRASCQQLVVGHVPERRHGETRASQTLPPSTCSRCRPRPAGRAGRRRPRAPAPARAARARLEVRRRVEDVRPELRQRAVTPPQLEHRPRSRGSPSWCRRGGSATAQPDAARAARPTRQRPFIRRWLWSTSPLSKRSSKFLPTASTASSVAHRPAARPPA